MRHPIQRGHQVIDPPAKHQGAHANRILESISIASTQQVSVLDNTMVAGKLQAFYRAMVRSKPPNKSTHTPPSNSSNPCCTADGYHSKACQPHSKVAKWTITRKIPPSPQTESCGAVIIWQHLPTIPRNHNGK